MEKKNYRFRAAEIEAMKDNILTHIANEYETKTAWRLRLSIEGRLMCCRPSKREAARLERELALYESLATNDLPNWSAHPTNAPQATETAEVENVSAESENTAETADIDKRTIEYYVKKHGNLHNLHIAYDGAMEAVRDELFEYRMTPRKGGRYRAERMAELQRKLDALGIEYMQIRRAMAQYLKDNVPTPPEHPRQRIYPPTRRKRHSGQINGKFRHWVRREKECCRNH